MVIFCSGPGGRSGSTCGRVLGPSCQLKILKIIIFMPWFGWRGGSTGRVLGPSCQLKNNHFHCSFLVQVEDVDPLVGELWAPLASSDKLSDSHHGSEVKQKKVKGAE
jgi:hypothetical protein